MLYVLALHLQCVCHFNYSILHFHGNNGHTCNVSKERSNVSGTVTVLPNLFVPITTLNYHHVTVNITTTMSHGSVGRDLTASG